MDLIQENQVKDNKEKKLKISLIIVVILIVALIATAIAIYFYGKNVLQKQLKVTIDGTTPSGLSSKMSDIFYIDDNGNVYTSIEDIAGFLDYKFFPGEYQQYSEDKSSGYITNQKETVVFSTNSKKIKKYPQLSNSEAQTFEINEPISIRGNSMFICEDGLERAFNLKLNYDKINNTISISTLNYLVTQYEKKNKELDVEDLDASINFNNQKALLNNLFVVKDEGNKLYGVKLLNNGEYVPVITTRYSSVEYMEGIEDFIVKTTDNKYGIIGKDGITKVKPDYKAIEEIDKDLGLYLVTSENNKQGVVNQNGKMIVYQDYDKIGLNDTYGDTSISNKYLIYDNCIPVMLNKKWGLINKEGKQILPLEYDGFGCSSVGRSNSTGMVVIPAINGIILEKDTVSPQDKNNIIKKYGVINEKGELMVNFIIDEAYITTIANEKTYYVTTQNQAIDIVKFFDEQKNNANQENSQNATENNLESGTSDNASDDDKSTSSEQNDANNNSDNSEGA